MKLIVTGAMLCIFSLLTKAQTSIYTFQLDSIVGSSKINFSTFQGKKILIVNTASQNTSFNQYDELKQLYQLYKDSLVIVIVPSNSFGSEQGGNSQIAVNYTQNNTYKFPVSRKEKVKNPDIHPLYAWLTIQSQNGMLSSEVSKPCFKYLINKNGEFRGVYGPRIRPMSTIMRHAIETVN